MLFLFIWYWYKKLYSFLGTCGYDKTLKRKYMSLSRYAYKNIASLSIIKWVTIFSPYIFSQKKGFTIMKLPELKLIHNKIISIYLLFKVGYSLISFNQEIWEKVQGILCFHYCINSNYFDVTTASFVINEIVLAFSNCSQERKSCNF